jgi:hypothetical protein
MHRFCSFLFVAFVVTLGILFPIGATFAQDAGGVIVTVPPTEVVLNWGDFVAIFLANISDPQSVAWTFVAGSIAWLVSRLPGPAMWAFNVFKVDQLLMNSLRAAINSTKGATVGQALSINVGSEVLAKAIQYAIDNGQKWLIDWMGGRQGIEQKLIARMDLNETVDGATLSAKVAEIGPVAITDKVHRPTG